MKKISVFFALLCLLPLALAWHNDPGNDSCITFYSDKAIYNVGRENPVLGPVTVKAENECGYAITGNLGVFFQEKDVQGTFVKGLQQSTSSHIETIENSYKCQHKTLFDKRVGTCYYDDINGMNVLFQQKVLELKEKTFIWETKRIVPDFFPVQKVLSLSIAVTGKEGFELSDSTGNVTIPEGVSYLKFLADLPKGKEHEQGFFIITFENDLRKGEKTVLDPAWREGIYDEFEDGDRTDDPIWANVEITGTVAVTEASKVFGTYGLEMSNINGNVVDIQVQGLALATIDTWTWVKTSQETVTASYYYLNTGGSHMCGLTNLNGTFIYRDSGGWQGFTATPTVNTWYIFRMAYDGTLVDYYVYDSSYNLIEEQLNKTPPNTGNVVRVSVYGSLSAGTIYWDDVGYGDSDPPEAPPAAVAPDVNLLTLEGLDLFEALPFFSYTADGNLTVDFNIFDVENDRITFDINYSLSATEGGGTVIYQDLNLTSDYCIDQDWNDVASTCSLDWNIADMGDNNFYLLVSASDGTDTDFNASGSSAGIDNNAPVYISKSPFSDSFLFQNDANFWLNASDSFSGLDDCSYTSYVDGSPDTNTTVDFNASGFCPVSEVLGQAGSTAFVRYYRLSDHAGNIVFAIRDTGIFTRAFSQSVDPENIQEGDIGRALTYFGFSLLQALGLAVVLILLFILVWAIFFR